MSSRFCQFQHFATSTSPITPSCSIWIACLIAALDRDCVPCATDLPLFFAAASSNWPSRTLWQHGFST